MQTLVLFASAACGQSVEEVEVAQVQAMHRVEAHYDRLWSRPPVRSEARGPAAGMVLWQAEGTPSRWPAWVARSHEVAASLYAPLGHERLTGSAPLESAPLLLLEALRQSPQRILDVAAPFVCAGLDRETGALDVFTDAVGVGRLFEVRTEDGWVWSNRPVAALRFAGRAAEPDDLAWLESAAADEFFGHSVPYAGVRALDPATHVHWDGRTRERRVSTVDTCAAWVPALTAGHDPQLIEAAADDLERVATSIGRLYTETPVVDLTGGRDSRLVAAAFLASGTDVVLHTHDALPGDLDTARSLVALLDEPVEHRIRHVATGGQVPPPRVSATASARRWHDYAEGLRPCTYLFSRAPAHVDAVTQVVVGGVGGEAAHGYYYPRDLAAIEALPVHLQVATFADHVVARHAPVPGASEQALEHVRTRVHGVLGRIASWGVRGGTILDHYYVLERMRRWGTTGERLGTVSPLLTSSFLAAALAVSPADRASNALHRELTRRLMPRWADVPYFPAEAAAAQAPSVRRPARVLRLGDAVDRAEVEEVLADTGDWREGFEAAEVHRLWHRSVAGGTTAQQERILRSVIWRGTFTDHVAGVSGRSPSPRPRVAVPRPGPPGRGDAGATRLVARLPRAGVRRALRHPLVRSMARTRLWSMARETAPGRAVRAAVRRLGR